MVKLKSMRVSNRYLFDLAHNKNLYEYISAHNCSQRENCLGPWTSGRADANLRVSLSEKSLADCVEALIGCYLIHVGTRASQVFIEWLDYVISEKEGRASFVEEETNAARVESVAPRVPAEMATQLANRYREFESALGYEFRNRAYLYQAFTHPSDTSNFYTSSYQK